jgi:galactose mutarotase-like enzyme
MSPADWISLTSDTLHVDVDPQGAQLSVLRSAAGADLLWDGDPAVWSGRAPILFPIVGALNGGEYRWRGRDFPLPRHGFARGRRFDLASGDRHTVVLRQRDDETTRAVYPFAFELDVTFSLVGAVLTIVATARNTGSDPMPASLGFHPAFRWPLPGAGGRTAHVLEFEHDEPSPVRRLDSAGLLTAEAYPTPVVGRCLCLRDDLFVADVVIFDRFLSRRARYHAGSGPTIDVQWPDATHLGLWSKPGAGFVCIEPWRGVADPRGFAGDLDAKPGAHVIQPGDEMVLTMVIEVHM